MANPKNWASRASESITCHGNLSTIPTRPLRNGGRHSIGIRDFDRYWVDLRLQCRAGEIDRYRPGTTNLRDEERFVHYLLNHGGVRDQPRVLRKRSKDADVISSLGVVSLEVGGEIVASNNYHWAGITQRSSDP